MAGVRKMIYIPSEEVWGGIQEAAKGEGRSVSNYLVQLHVLETKKNAACAKMHNLAKNQQDMPPEFNKVVDKMIMESPKTDIERKEKIKGITKKRKAGWTNPLSNSVLAPKG